MSTAAPDTAVRGVLAAGVIAELFHAHGRMVLGICRIHLRDEHEAEDAAQETFVRAHRSLLAGQLPDRPGPWLAAIARNECRDRARARRRANAPALGVDLDRLVATQPDAAHDQLVTTSALQEALLELPMSQREAFILGEMLGLRYDEIASALDTTEGAVESLLVRVRRRLKHDLKPLRAVAAAALLVPLTLRDSIAHAVIGFPAASATTGTASATGGAAAGSVSAMAGSGVASAGILSAVKLAAAPLVAKVVW